MKLKLKTLSEYLSQAVYKSKNITRADGIKLIIVKMREGIFIVDTENGYDYSKYTKNKE